MDPSGGLENNLQKIKTLVVVKIQSLRVFEMAQSKAQIFPHESMTSTRDAPWFERLFIGCMCLLCDINKQKSFIAY